MQRNQTQVCIQFASDELDVKQLICRVSRENEASIRVIKKLGMTFLKYDDCEGIPDAAFYSLTIKNG